MIYRDILRELVLLLIIRMFCRLACPAPRPLSDHRKMPSGHVNGQPISCVQPSRVTNEVRPTSADLAFLPDNRTSSEAGETGSQRGRRGRRSRARGRRGALRWIGPGVAKNGEVMIGQLNIQSSNPRHLISVTTFSMCIISTAWCERDMGYVKRDITSTPNRWILSSPIQSPTEQQTSKGPWGSGYISFKFSEFRNSTEAKKNVCRRLKPRNYMGTC